jgi:DNA invertase Pin-like site-specific DNA recombinase
MPLIGYARVSTEDQTPLPQSQALKSAGCAEIHEEQASGGNRARPVLARVLERIGKGDTLVVVRIDRLARSLSHLLEVIERLEAKGAFFRSLRTRSTRPPRRASSPCRSWAPRPSSSAP